MTSQTQTHKVELVLDDTEFKRLNHLIDNANDHTVNQVSTDTMISFMINEAYDNMMTHVESQRN